MHNRLNFASDPSQLAYSETPARPQVTAYTVKDQFTLEVLGTVRASSIEEAERLAFANWPEYTTSVWQRGSRI